MKKMLLVIDMQYDFVNEALGTPEAQAITENVREKIRAYREAGRKVVFTRDTHHEETYMTSNEGIHLPVLHCIEGTHGWELLEGLAKEDDCVIDKPTFGWNHWLTSCPELKDESVIREGIEIIGLCTDICVVSNALLIKTAVPELEITVDSSCCAGVTPASHEAALQTMRSCQINVI